MKLATEYATFLVGVSKDGVQQGMVYCHVKNGKRGIVSWLTTTEARELAAALLKASGVREDNSLARTADDSTIQDEAKADEA